MDLASLMKEVQAYLDAIIVGEEGEHLWDNYQEITAMSLRLQQIHNDLAFLEIAGEIDPEFKRFRTMVVDPTIERLDKIAAFESRKITAKQIEFNMEKG